MTPRALARRLAPYWPLLLAVAVGLALRLLWVLVWNPTPVVEGGDTSLYIRIAYYLVHEGTFHAGGLLFAVPPVFSFLIAPLFALFDLGLAFVAARLLEVYLSVATVLAVHALAKTLFDQRAALLAAWVMALDLRFVVQAGALHTETTFVLLLVVSVLTYVLYADRGLRAFLLIGLLLGLTSLTRWIGVALPALFLFDQALRFKPRAYVPRTLVMGAAFGAVLLAWGAYNAVTVGQFRVMDGAAGNFFIGATESGGWEGQDEFAERVESLERDEATTQPSTRAYIEAAFRSILSDVPGYVTLLARKLTRAYVQPDGTVVFPGESIRAGVAALISGDIGIVDLFSFEGFWPKLYIYVFHFGVLLATPFALWRQRTRWRQWLVLVLVIVGFSGAYTLLTIIPRYLFPLMAFYTVLASGLVASVGQTQVETPAPR